MNGSAIIHTLGCKVNQYDAEAISSQLVGAGFSILDEEDASCADVCIIFTCSVTNESDRKSRQAIRHLIQRHPNALIVAASCYAEVRPDELREIPGVDLVIGTSLMDRLVPEVFRALSLRQEVSTNTSLTRFTRRTRAFIKIQDGCDQFCAYCQIPLTRGLPRSRPLNEVLDEVKTLVEHGHREVVLCGIRLGAYGLDRGERDALPRLLFALDDIPNLQRYRLSSIEPNDISEDLKEAFTSLRHWAPHLHIPLQGGSDSVLARMNRHYTIADYRHLLATLRSSNEKLAISTDLLVGFPGETDQEAEETRLFATEMEFSKVHLFPFSPRPGTKAAEMGGRIHGKIVETRKNILNASLKESAQRFCARFIGKSLTVLLEDKTIRFSGEQDEYVTGFSENYLRVGVLREENLLLLPGHAYCTLILGKKGSLLLGRAVPRERSGAMLPKEG